MLAHLPHVAQLRCGNVWLGTRAVWFLSLCSDPLALSSRAENEVPDELRRGSCPGQWRSGRAEIHGVKKGELGSCRPLMSEGMAGAKDRGQVPAQCIWQRTVEIRPWHRGPKCICDKYVLSVECAVCTGP